MEEKDLKLEELSKNEEFLGKLTKVENVEDAKALFAEYGVEVTDQEIIDLKDSFSATELNEEDLDKVAGGELQLVYKCSCGMTFIHKALAKLHDKNWGHGHELLPGKYNPFIW